MRKRSKVLIWIASGIVVLGGAAVIVGPNVYANYVKGTTDAPASLSADANAGAGAKPLENLSGTWNVGAGSFAGYRVDEVLYNQHVTVTGRGDKVTGSVTADGLTLKEAKFTVDVASITTPEAARDSYFRGSVLQVNQFPTATFSLSGPATAKLPAPGKPESFEVKGDLTLRGVTKPVTVTLKTALTAKGGQVTGTIPITFSDFGIQAPSLGFVTVEKSGSVEFLLNLSKQ